jgi:hypothetical protein
MYHKVNSQAGHWILTSGGIMTSGAAGGQGDSGRELWVEPSGRQKFGSILEATHLVGFSPVYAARGYFVGHSSFLLPGRQSGF